MTTRVLLANDEAARIPSGREPARVRARLVTPLLLLFLLGTLDVLLTLIGLSRGGHELNPYAHLVLRGGFAAFVTARVATFTLATSAVLWLAPSAPHAARACVASAILVFLAVDLRSVAQLVRS